GVAGRAHPRGARLSATAARTRARAPHRASRPRARAAPAPAEAEAEAPDATTAPHVPARLRDRGARADAVGHRLSRRLEREQLGTDRRAGVAAVVTAQRGRALERRSERFAARQASRRGSRFVRGPSRMDAEPDGIAKEIPRRVR